MLKPVPYIGARDAISPSKIFLGKNCLDIGQILLDLDEIWAKVISIGQNENLASPKTFDLLRLWLKR